MNNGAYKLFVGERKNDQGISDNSETLTIKYSKEFSFFKKRKFSKLLQNLFFFVFFLTRKPIEKILIYITLNVY